MVKIKNNGFIDDKYELVIKEFQSILSVFYLILIGIGMLFSYEKYSQFGINIFQYSDIFDFLLTPFRDFTILIFSFVTVLLVFLIYKLNELVKKKYPKFYNSKFNFGLIKTKPVLSIILTFVFYLFLTSEKYGELSKNRILNNPRIVEITLNNSKVIKGNLIGKNNEYLFLLEKNNEVKIYPVTNSLTIKVINPVNYPE
jgi:hypothetical protein